MSYTHLYKDTLDIKTLWFDLPNQMRTLLELSCNCKLCTQYIRNLGYITQSYYIAYLDTNLLNRMICISLFTLFMLVHINKVIVSCYIKTMHICLYLHFHRFVVNVKIVHSGHFILDANFLLSFIHIPESHTWDITVRHFCHHTSGHSFSVVLHAFIATQIHSITNT